MINPYFLNINYLMYAMCNVVVYLVRVSYN